MPVHFYGYACVRTRACLFTCVCARVCVCVCAVCLPCPVSLIICVLWNRNLRRVCSDSAEALPVCLYVCVCVFVGVQSLAELEALENPQQLEHPQRLQQPQQPRVARLESKPSGAIDSYSTLISLARPNRLYLDDIPVAWEMMCP
jgi:hypothetical protein